MTGSVSAISMFAPFAATNPVFAFRRASNGINSLSNNPLYGVMNMDIAAGQTLNGLKAINEISANTTGKMSSIVQNGSEAMKRIRESSKVAKVATKAISYTADHINPIICVASAAKVVGSKDKPDTLTRETCSLGTMFLFENATKRFLGLTAQKGANGEIIKPQQALYRKSAFLSRHIDKFKTQCESTKYLNCISLKMLPGALKGIAFIFASITGYKVGSEIATLLIGKPKND